MSTEPSPTIGATWSPGRKDDLVVFLTRLAADDDPLYEQVQDDPQSVLAQWGIAIPGELVENARSLPSKEQLRNLLSTLEGEPVGPQPPFSPCLVIGLAMAAGAGP